MRRRFGITQRRQLTPALAPVLADVEMRRQRAGEDHFALLQATGPRRPEFVMSKAVVHPAPFEAAIVAAGHADAAR